MYRPVGQLDAGDATGRRSDPHDLAPSRISAPAVVGHVLERRTQGLEASSHVPAAVARLDVRDARQRRWSPIRRRPRVRGIPTGPLDEAGVREVRRGQVGAACGAAGSLPDRPATAGDVPAPTALPSAPRGTIERRPPRSAPPALRTVATAPPRPARTARTPRQSHRSRRERRATSRRASGSGTGGRVEPSSTCSDSVVPAARNSSSNTSGSVSNDGPMSMLNPSRCTQANLPPVTSRRSHTTTRRPAAARRMAAASPPTPAPIDDDVGSISHGVTKAMRASGSMPARADQRDGSVAEEQREPDRLHRRPSRRTRRRGSGQREIGGRSRSNATIIPALVTSQPA